MTDGEAAPRILVVDDDPQVRRSLERGLRLAGFDVDVAEGGRSALDRLADGEPDAIVLDVTMPDIDGVEVCRRLRDVGIEVPVCMLSARDDVEDRVAGLRAGADDYLVKPFSFEELRLRLEALLRRRMTAIPDQPAGDAIRVGELAVDAAARTVSWAGEEIDLTRREFDLLETLVRNRGSVLSRAQLLDQVWGYDFDVRTNVVDVFVGYVRRKLTAAGADQVIETVRGVGYVVRPGS
ncbi:MAG: response regulator transcription factor [Actinomycetota bacterium]